MWPVFIVSQSFCALEFLRRGKGHLCGTITHSGDQLFGKVAFLANAKRSKQRGRYVNNKLGYSMSVSNTSQTT